MMVTQLKHQITVVLVLLVEHLVSLLHTLLFSVLNLPAILKVHLPVILIGIILVIFSQDGERINYTTMSFVLQVQTLLVPILVANTSH